MRQLNKLINQTLAYLMVFTDPNEQLDIVRENAKQSYEELIKQPQIKEYFSRNEWLDSDGLPSRKAKSIYLSQIDSKKGEIIPYSLLNSNEETAKWVYNTRSSPANALQLLNHILISAAEEKNITSNFNGIIEQELFKQTIQLCKNLISDEDSLTLESYFKDTEQFYINIDLLFPPTAEYSELRKDFILYINGINSKLLTETVIGKQLLLENEQQMEDNIDNTVDVESLTATEEE